MTELLAFRYPARVSMRDVARAAGVSAMTVSRVLNGAAHVLPSTRERVEQALSELGYRPNAAARALATGRSGQLAVILSSSTHFGPASTLFAIEQAARRVGYAVSIVSLPHLTPETMGEAMSQLLTRAVDGSIIIVSHSTSAALRVISPDLPAVVVGATQPAGLPLAAIDQETGARRATEHLLALGHKTVHHVAGPTNWIDAQVRVRGWSRALERVNAVVPAPLAGDWSARSGYQAGLRLAGNPAVTAIFVANDQMALGVLRALEEVGRAVPHDVSVVGFDDVPEAPYYPTALTTVRQDFEAVGALGVSLLLDRLGGQLDAPRRMLTPEIIIRDSTAPPPSTSS